MSKYENGLFIFRRDMRTIDNIGLNLINSMCKKIYPVFIFTPEQVTNANKYKSDNAVQFMIESLEDLYEKTDNKLLCFYGHNNTIVLNLIKQLDIHIVVFNADYSPFAIQRDADIQKICEKAGIAIEYASDYYLHPPGTILNGQGQPYQKFTPFYNNALTKKVDAPTGLRKMHFVNTTKNLPNRISLDDALKRFINKPTAVIHGGRNNAIKQIHEAIKRVKHYSNTRNEVSKPTSQLSAYIKFGCISIREVYKVFKSNPDFIRQLYWRDFYANILYSFPRVLGNTLKPKYNQIKWRHNDHWFDAWKKGETGFPIVDAGMRELNATGYMHNRTRLIVASFLVKTLLISWEEGERYFSTKLTDYDPASNNGNWQWIAGTGADSQPYFRIFNPWEQTKHYDPECEYIKKWVSELKDVPVNHILKWNETNSMYSNIHYFKPICDYTEQKEKILKMYASIF